MSDVYKRQAWYGIDKQPKDMQTNRLGVVDKHGPVSYTHLDVYKRQGKNKSNRNIRIKTALRLSSACIWSIAVMSIIAILHMHAELSLTAVFILMFLLDLFLPARCV